MSESSTIHVGLDVHRESITVAYVGADRTQPRTDLPRADRAAHQRLRRVAMIAEFGGLTRFEKPRQLMVFPGRQPGEYTFHFFFSRLYSCSYGCSV